MAIRLSRTTKPKIDLRDKDSLWSVMDRETTEPAGH
jgi:hypothetical protein